MVPWVTSLQKLQLTWGKTHEIVLLSVVSVQHARNYSTREFLLCNKSCVRTKKPHLNELFFPAQEGSGDPA